MSFSKSTLFASIASIALTALPAYAQDAAEDGGEGDEERLRLHDGRATGSRAR